MFRGNFVKHDGSEQTSRVFKKFISTENSSFINYFIHMSRIIIRKTVPNHFTDKNLYFELVIVPVIVDLMLKSVQVNIYMVKCR